MDARARHIILFSGILDIIILDQLSKWAITEYVIAPKLALESTTLWDWIAHAPDKLPFAEITLTSFFNLVMVWNYGVSFGLFNTGAADNALILSALALIICAVFCVWLARSTDWMQGIALMLVIGGAIGNVIDRLRFGAVIDFIDLHLMGYHWPAFNLADSAIVIGVIILLIHGLFFDNDNKTLSKNTDSP